MLIKTFDSPSKEICDGDSCQEATGRGSTEGGGADAGRANFEGLSVRMTKLRLGRGSEINIFIWISGSVTEEVSG